MATTNRFEDRSRARKVAAIVSRLPSAETAEDIEFIGAWLAARGPAERASIAAAAGVSPPSDATWSAVVKAARALVPLTAVYARIKAAMKNPQRPCSEGGAKHSWYRIGGALKCRSCGATVGASR